ncbi:transcriptional regulator [Streptomonospora alba]|uniref:Transcriptional regulator n=2 Tax=Streptomonospora alba TaxID=183763 RepID=A0A0C2JEF2_9ACTN|nr:transcriptional regulator [Streptomonospora alba]
MQTFDRMGIHLEQCESCRGIFLDRGELEQIISAEQRHYGAAPPGPSGPAGTPPPVQPYRDSPRPYGGHGGGYKDSPRPYGGHGGGYGGGYKDSPRPYGQRRKKSFLEQLFD